MGQIDHEKYFNKQQSRFSVGSPFPDALKYHMQ